MTLRMPTTRRYWTQTNTRWGMEISFTDDDTLEVGEGIVVFKNRRHLEIDSDGVEVTFADLDTGSREEGKDYYVFATPDGIVLSVIPQSFPASKDSPSGYDADSSLLLGWFHNGKEFESDSDDGAIFEYSICDYQLIHRAWNYQYPYRAHRNLPPGVPLPGMVHVGNQAFGIYAASREDATASSAGSSDYPTSRYGVVPWCSIEGWEAIAAARNAGCRLPTWEEWLGAVQWNPGSATPARMNGNTDYLSASDCADHLDNPGAPTVGLAGAGAGNLSDGDYTYVVTLVNANGETHEGSESATVTVADHTSDGQIDLSSIPIGAAGTTARKIYRTEAGGSAHKLVATINDNTTTSYRDNVADADLGATAPTENTTGDQQMTSDPTRVGRGLVGTGPRTESWGATTDGRSWYSPAGLADAVGNIWEWVGQFFGGLQQTSPGGSTEWGEGDRAYNFEGQAYNPDTGGWTEGLPALLHVGGGWGSGSSAGVRAADANNSPGRSLTHVGFRLSR